MAAERDTDNEDTQNIDSTQPGSKAKVNLTDNDLSTVDSPDGRAATIEESDDNDVPVADLARELPPEMKEAVDEMGTWSGRPGSHRADNAEDTDTDLDKLSGPNGGEQGKGPESN